MNSVTRQLNFCAGHRLLEHEGKCRHLHGHEYRVEIEVTALVVAKELDSVGRVVDFGVIKELVGGWLDDNFDHGTIYNIADNPLRNFLWAEKQKHYGMNKNPTAENIALEIHRAATGLLAAKGLRVVKVVVHETPNCSATYTPPGE